MTTLEKLSATDAQAIFDRLPTRIKTALLDRATEIEYPIEMVVETACGRAIGCVVVPIASPMHQKLHHPRSSSAPTRLTKKTIAL
jgi:hypothetical protein